MQAVVTPSYCSRLAGSWVAGQPAYGDIEEAVQPEGSEAESSGGGRSRLWRARWVLVRMSSVLSGRGGECSQGLNWLNAWHIEVAPL